MADHDDRLQDAHDDETVTIRQGGARPIRAREVTIRQGGALRPPAAFAFGAGAGLVLSLLSRRRR